ncbi:hypothetical protein ACLMAJ_08535 [Nocardia sp. KC 131]|uniref:hypothetical protein n=1 Tax=Nocardia arseniciresistens TaxID=3392119 RepID=UPI00398E8B8A
MNISSAEFNGVGAEGDTEIGTVTWRKSSTRPPVTTVDDSPPHGADPGFAGVRWIQGALYERAAAV